MPKQFNQGEVVGCLFSGHGGNAKLTPALPRSRVRVRQMVAVRFLIRKVWQGIFGMDSDNGCGWFSTRYPAELDPLDENTQASFPAPSWDPTQKTPQHGDWGVCKGVMSEGCPSVTSEKHMTWGLIGVSLDVIDELHDGTSHEVTLINLISVTDGGHVFLEGQRHS